MDMFKNNVFVIALTTFAMFIIGVFVWVLVTGADTDKLVEFFRWLLTVVPVLVIGIMQAKNNSTISQQVSNVETATNGAMTNRLNEQTVAITDNIKQHIDSTIAPVVTGIPTLTPLPPMPTESEVS